MGRTEGVYSSLKLFVLCKDQWRLAHDQAIWGWVVTWGEIGQLVCADLAEALLRGLDIRVEALCEL